DPVARADWRGAADRVRAATGAGALAVVAPPHQLLPLAYHLSPEAFADQRRLAERLRAERVIALASPGDLVAMLPPSPPPVLVVMTEASATRHADLAAALAAGGLAPVASERLEGLVLLRFARAGG
ncbi:MAG: hypothetical protein AB1689_15970, partial [Thermodesulfobacteriota bacterium]